jgi:acyl-CoA hydrolase
VTEYGIARLRGRTVEERVQALIKVAHPNFRETLHAKAVELGYL